MLVNEAQLDSPVEIRRREALPIGAEPQPGGGVRFRLWAPRRTVVEAVFESDGLAPLKLQPEDDGYFSALAPHATSGALYRFRLDNGDARYPDPASRFQPQGPHGPSQVIDPTDFYWSDQDWRGISAERQVLYEMHIGTFTPEGTWVAAERELPELVDLGITCLEVMPVADFPGKFGWGYDGVNLFAPTRLYGEPDDFRRFVDRAHALGIGVILDVVYNHVGPDGNYLKEFSQDYFTCQYKTDWGEAINFDGKNSGPVREFYLANARYWIEEFHLDGYRFDATQNIYDSSKDHILAAISRTARRAAGKRTIFLVNENEPQHTTIVRAPQQGGYGMDALWNDDFHHSAIVRLTGHNEGYFADYYGKPQEFISVAKFGYLYQGQRYAWQSQRRGTPTLDLPPTAFVNFVENHDQLANLPRGQRVSQLTGRAQYRAMMALLLLMPGTPMIFQGQEFSASSPFNFFADHNAELANLVRKGRAEFMAQFLSAATPEMQACLADPSAEATFQHCKLNHQERKRPGHAEIHGMFRDLISLRRSELAFSAHWPGGLDGAVLGADAMVLRFFDPAGDDRLLLVNFGTDMQLDILPEPLLAPPLEKTWHPIWSSEDPKYLGNGLTPITASGKWRLPGHAAVVMKPIDAPPDHRDVGFYLEGQKVKQSV